MSTVLPNMGLKQPTQGAAGAGDWDDDWDDNAEAIDAHDHSSGKGVTVKTAGISINADLTFSSLYAPINLHRLTFASIVALSSNNKSLFVNTADNELYWRSNAGTNVKLTSGSSLNVAAFVGGVGGDYAATSALVDYDDATDTYRFRQELNTSVRQFAKVRFADIQLVEYDAAGDASVPANAVTIKSPDALAANYSVTMPAALPASDSRVVQIDSTGQLSFAPASPPASTSVLSMSSTGAVAAGMSMTWSHSPALVSLSDATAALAAGSFAGPTAPRVTLSTSTGPHSFPLSIPVGTITAFSVHCHKSSAAGTLSAKLVESANGNGVAGLTQIGSTQSNSANNPGDITLGQSGLSFAMTAGRQYYIEIIGGGTTGDSVGPYSATVTV